MRALVCHGWPRPGPIPAVAQAPPPYSVLGRGQACGTCVASQRAGAAFTFRGRSWAIQCPVGVDW